MVARTDQIMRTSNCLIVPIKRSVIGLALLTVIGIFANAMVCNAASVASNSTEELRYRVRHSVFGNIGTYTNVVQSVGDLTTVRTSVHFLVTMLGIGLHREDA